MKKLMLLALGLALTLSSCTINRAPEGGTYAALSDQQAGTERCIATYRRPDFAAGIQALNAARARWDAVKVTNYSLVYTFGAPPAPPVKYRLTVRSGQAAVLEDLQTGSLPLDPKQEAQSVEALFDRVYSAYKYAATTRCVAVTVKYDATFGFPTEVTTAQQEPGLADGEVYWRVTEFKKL